MNIISKMQRKCFVGSRKRVIKWVLVNGNIKFLWIFSRSYMILKVFKAELELNLLGGKCRTSRARSLFGECRNHLAWLKLKQ